MLENEVEKLVRSTQTTEGGRGAQRLKRIIFVKVSPQSPTSGAWHAGESISAEGIMWRSSKGFASGITSRVPEGKTQEHPLGRSQKC